MSRLKLIFLFLLVDIGIAFGIGIYPTSRDAGTLYTNDTYSYQYMLTNDLIYNTSIKFEVTSGSSSLAPYVTFNPSSASFLTVNDSLAFNVTIDPNGMSTGSYRLVFKPKVTVNENVSLNPNGVQTGGALVVIPAGILNFNVQEVTTTTIAPGPGVGGGGGGAKKVSNFTIMNDSVKVSLKQGEVKTVYVIVENTGEKTLKLWVDMGSLDNIVFPEEDSFVLKPGETEKLLLDVVARKDMEPDLYAGKLTIKSVGIQRSIPFYVEVESKEALFDVKVDIPDKYKKVLPGEDVYFIVSIYNLNRIGLVDVNVEYIVKDLENNVILTDGEVKAVETEVSFFKNIHIPLTAVPGKYVLYVKVTYDDSVAIASETFEVTEFYFPIIHPTILLAIITAIVLLFAYLRREKKKLKRRKKRRRKKRFKKNRRGRRH